jgi:hypothetical protein
MPANIRSYWAIAPATGEKWRCIPLAYTWMLDRASSLKGETLG